MAKTAAPVLAASQRAFGLGAPGIARMPQDYGLGPLQDYRPSAEGEARALVVARRFIDGLAAGRLDAALLVPDSRDALALLLAPAKAEAAAGEGSESSCRLGAMKVEGDSASLRVRFPAGGAPVEGSLTLGEVGGSWYVEALSIDPSAVAGDRTPVFDRSD